MDTFTCAVTSPETHRKSKMKVLARVLKEFDIYHVFILLRNNLNKTAVNQGLYWY